MFVNIIAFYLISTIFLKNPTSENLEEKFKNWGGLENEYSNYPNLNIHFTPKNEEEKVNLIFNNSSALARHFPFTGIVFIDENTIKYKIKSGDTFEKIASYFNTTPQEIKKQNNIKSLKTGSWIIINTSTKNTQEKFTPDSNLPSFKNYFSLPASGWNWGDLHNYNAVDISNKCGTPVYAAADGIVISDKNLGSGEIGWNNGYGIFVLLEHQNGTKTRYAHLDKALVKIGDVVKKGQKIGVMGNTGNSHGPSGCHLHFEVYGAKNPFAKN